MGIILSILVSFVGVIELLAFYSHLRRFIAAETEELSDLTIIRRNYLDILAKRYTLNLQRDPGQSRNPSNYSLRTSPKAVVIGKPRDDLVLSKHEDVPLNNDKLSGEGILNGACPKVIPVIEDKLEEDVSQGVKHKDIFYSKASTSKETYTIRESSKKKTLKHHKSELLEKVDVSKLTDSEDEPTVEKIYLADEAPIDRIHGRRSSSPFPTYERMKPRGSICGELVDNPKINVTEVDEEESDHNSAIFWSSSKSVQRGSRSRSPSPKRKRAPTEEEHRSTEYYGPKLTIRPKKNRSVSPEPRSEKTERYLTKRRRSKSFTNVSEFNSSVQIADMAYQLVDRDYWSRSPSPFKEFLDEPEDNKFCLVFDEKFKDSLDGVKQKEDLKKNFKKRHGKKDEKVNKMLCYKEDEFLQPFNDAITPTSSTEKFAGAILSNQDVVCAKSDEAKIQEATPSTSKEVKKPEAFWVK